ncbi:hypothetical protein FA95DRAFT_1603552 [Auriscalpium vulgare]|uniref:Uncharacterized protein n=1 Tax=Auriscalpium vulgare TaxID=40419 RepID=A0ACB8S2I7_9AGAM|nr:hypothetical protein FA95DRAFT_1603552 [Auriscalpium vulgare]
MPQPRLVPAAPRRARIQRNLFYYMFKSTASDDLRERSQAFWTTSADERIASLLLPSSDPENDVTHTPSAILDAEEHGLHFSLLAVRSRLNALAPISMLPPEILARVFACLILVYPCPKEAPRLGWNVGATHVCRSWREVALSHPTLWTHISFDCGPKLAQEMLTRAKSALLVICDDSWDPESQEAADSMILSNVSRLQELKVDRYLEAWQTLGPVLTLPAPMLQVVDLTVRIVDSSVRVKPPTVTTLFAGRANRLREISIDGYNFAWTCFPRSPLITRLALTTRDNSASKQGDPVAQLNPDIFCDLLSALPALEDIPDAISNTPWPGFQIVVTDEENATTCVVSVPHIHPAPHRRRRTQSTPGPATDNSSDKLVRQMKGLSLSNANLTASLHVECVSHMEGDNNSSPTSQSTEEDDADSVGGVYIHTLFNLPPKDRQLLELDDTEGYESFRRRISTHLLAGHPDYQMHGWSAQLRRQYRRRSLRPPFGDPEDDYSKWKKCILSSKSVAKATGSRVSKVFASMSSRLRKASGVQRKGKAARTEDVLVTAKSFSSEELRSPLTKRRRIEG